MGLEGLGNQSSKLYSPDYPEAVGVVQNFLDSSAAVNASAFEATDSWLASHADDVITAEQVLHVGQPWGALEMAAGAKGIPTSTLFMATAKTEEASGATAWRELVETGTFSAQTLNAPTALTFQTSNRWMELLRQSATAHNDTWLHKMHFAVHAADVSDFATARRETEESIALRSTALAFRNRAVLGPSDELFSNYAKAWEVAIESSDVDGLRLRRNLASEICAVMIAGGTAAQLQSFVGALETEYEREADVVVKARVIVVSLHLVGFGPCLNLNSCCACQPSQFLSRAGAVLVTVSAL
jgi:hypothetical protein